MSPVQETAAENQRNAPKPTSESSAITPEMVRQQVDRLLAHPLFLHSKRSRSLLQFLVNQTRSGEYESLKERNIGIEVFGRSAGFDTALDSTVRVAATEVRRRLALYYSEPEHGQELYIQLPLRSYAVEIALPAAPKAEPELPRPARLPRKNDWRYASAALVLVLCLLLWGGYSWQHSREPAIDRFWGPIVRGSGPAQIAISSLAESETEGPAQASRPALRRAAVQSDLLPQQMLLVSKQDLASAMAIASYLGYSKKPSSLQAAHDTSTEERKAWPAIVLGSLGSERAGANYRYRLHHDSDSSMQWIEDSTNPGSRKWSIGRTTLSSQDRKEYALITRALDGAAGQWWIGAAGLTGLGTSAARQMILDSGAMDALSRKLPGGWEKKNLQVVLEIDVEKESPGAPQIVATYCW